MALKKEKKQGAKQQYAQVGRTGKGKRDNCLIGNLHRIKLYNKKETIAYYIANTSSRNDFHYPVRYATMLRKPRYALHLKKHNQ